MSIAELTHIPRQDLAKARRSWYLDAKSKWKASVQAGEDPMEICNKGVPRGVVLEWMREIGKRPGIKHDPVDKPKRLPSRESLMNEYFANPDRPGTAELVSLARLATVSITDLVGNVIDED